MKKLLTICAVAGLMLGFSALAIAAVVDDLFNDEDRTTEKVRSDTEDDYGYDASLYPDLRVYKGTGWQSVSLPFAGTNASGSAFDVQRDDMETMRFYLVCKDGRYYDGDDPHFQIDNVKLTKNGGGELLIDDFSGALQWSYHQHPAPSSPPGGVAVAIVGGVLDIQVTDIDARDWGPNWEMNYIDIFSCDGDEDSFIYGDDWSAYDNLEFKWQVLDSGTRRTYIDLYVRTDVPQATAITLASFTAQAGAGGVTLAWETGTELDNAGFNLYRATAEDGPYTKINEALFAAQGDAVAGAGYSFADAPGYGTFYYRLEDVDLNGASTLHGPVKATVARPFRRPLYRPSVPH